MVRQTARDAIEELAQLLDGELSAEEAAAPVRVLASLAGTVRESETVARPSAATRAALRNQLVAEITARPVSPVERVRDAVWQRTARWRHSARVGVVTAVTSGMLGSAGIAVAAQGALPGDALYGVKRTTESLRLALASGLREEAGVHLALAEERLEELAAITSGRSTDAIVDTLDAMDASTVRGADALVQAVTDGAERELLTQLTSFTERQRAGLLGLYGHLPLGARPFADESLEVLRRIDVHIATTLQLCGVCGPAAAGGAVSPPTAPADGGRGVAPAPACDCVEVAGPPPARDPGLPGPGVPTVPAEDDGNAAGDERPGESRERVVVPPLPNPLEPVGTAVDDTLGGIVDGLVDEVTDDPTATTAPGEVVADTVETTTDVVEDVDDAVTDTGSELDGLLDPTS